MRSSSDRSKKGFLQRGHGYTPRAETNGIIATTAASRTPNLVMCDGSRQTPTALAIRLTAAAHSTRVCLRRSSRQRYAYGSTATLGVTSAASRSMAAPILAAALARADSEITETTFRCLSDGGSLLVVIVDCPRTKRMRPAAPILCMVNAGVAARETARLWSRRSQTSRGPAQTSWDSRFRLADPFGLGRTRPSPVRRLGHGGPPARRAAPRLSGGGRTAADVKRSPERGR